VSGRLPRVAACPERPPRPVHWRRLVGRPDHRQRFLDAEEVDFPTGPLEEQDVYPHLTEEVKFSLVYSYHGCSNAPKPGTRSASKAEVAL